MKILSKYVLKEHTGPLVFALAALTSLLLLNYVAKQFGALVGKGLPWTAILEFFGLSIPFTVATTLPMNAYLLDGASKYKTWIVEYMDAWLDRMARNRGIIPLE